MLLDPVWRQHLIVPFMVVALVAYALVAMITELRWISGSPGGAVGWPPGGSTRAPASPP